MSRLATLLCCVLLAALPGCASLEGLSETLNPLSDKPIVADSTNPAVEMACVWQPGEGPGGYGVPARGFSGQVFFFTNRNSEPVLVDGTVRIYLFADRGTPEERARPLKQFDFGPQAWQAHATMASLGPGYSVFVPYPETAAYQVRCELRARFTPSHGGPPVWSEGVTMVLDGPPRPGSEPASWTNNGRGASSPTVASFEIEHDRGTLEQLRDRDGSDEKKPERTLRTDTFTLGPVRQVAFESSRDGGRPVPRPVPLTEDRKSRQVNPLREESESGSHSLDGPKRSIQTESPIGPHSLAKSPFGRPGTPHPMKANDTPSASATPGVSEEPPARFQLTPASSPSPVMPGDPAPTSGAHPLAG